MISEQSECFLTVREKVDPQELPSRVYALATGWRELISSPGLERLIASDNWVEPFFRLYTFSYGNWFILSRVWIGSWEQILRLVSVPDISGTVVDLSGIEVTGENISKQWKDGEVHEISPDELLPLCLLLPKYSRAKLSVGKNVMYFTPYQSPEEILYEEGVFGWSFLDCNCPHLPDGVVKRTYSFLVHLFRFANAWEIRRIVRIEGSRWTLSWAMPSSVVVGNFSLSAEVFRWEEVETPTGVETVEFPDIAVRCTTPEEVWRALLAIQNWRISRMYWTKAETIQMRFGYFPEVYLI